MAPPSHQSTVRDALVHCLFSSSNSLLLLHVAVGLLSSVLLPTGTCTVFLGVAYCKLQQELPHNK